MLALFFLIWKGEIIIIIIIFICIIIGMASGFLIGYCMRKSVTETEGTLYIDESEIYAELKVPPTKLTDKKFVTFAIAVMKP